MVVKLGILLLAIAAAGDVRAAATQGAEFAVRWSSRESGPDSLDAVEQVLGVKLSKVSTYRVNYFEADLPADAPPGAALILRERSKASAIQTTWKYRSDAQIHTLGPGSWHCPLSGDATHKDEVDLSLVEDGAVRKRYSRSCSVSRPLAEAIPPTMKVEKKGCSASMRRRETKDGLLKVEEWRTTDGSTFLEVSWIGEDSSKDLLKFRRAVFDRITLAGAKPMDRTKTQLSTQCGS